MSDNKGGAATGTINMSVNYGFVNAQNLPPAKSVTSGQILPLKWQWTNTAKTPLNSSGAQPELLVTPVAVTGLPAGWSGDFTVASPGTGNSFGSPTSANKFTWTFNWTLTYTDPSTGHQVNLPPGTYLVRVKSNLTGQLDPSTVNKDGTTGAEVVIK